MRRWCIAYMWSCTMSQSSNGSTPHPCHTVRAHLGHFVEEVTSEDDLPKIRRRLWIALMARLPPLPSLDASIGTSKIGIRSKPRFMAHLFRTEEYSTLYEHLIEQFESTTVGVEFEESPEGLVWAHVVSPQFGLIAPAESVVAHQVLQSIRLTHCLFGPVHCHRVLNPVDVQAHAIKQWPVTLPPDGETHAWSLCECVSLATFGAPGLVRKRSSEEVDEEESQSFDEAVENALLCQHVAISFQL